MRSAIFIPWIAWVIDVTLRETKHGRCFKGRVMVPRSLLFVRFAIYRTSFLRVFFVRVGRGGNADFGTATSAA